MAKGRVANAGAGWPLNARILTELVIICLVYEMQLMRCCCCNIKWEVYIFRQLKYHTPL